LKAYPKGRWSAFFSEQPSVTPAATAGEFQFNALRPGEDIRLSAGQTAFVYTDLPEYTSPVDFFLDKRANVLINPPFERRDDLRAAPHLQIADVPGGTWEYIIFNTANPNKPKSAFDDQGQPIDQGHHPLFGDIRVRRAVQLGIDDHELAEVVYQGNVTPLASSLPPMSWGFNAALTTSSYDPRAAEHLLDEAGWRDANRDGVRECHGCLYAHEGDNLSFNLIAAPYDDLYSEEDIIARQLGQIGFSVGVGYDDFSSVEFQTFDAYLTAGTMTADAADSDPDQSVKFSQSADVLGQVGNYGSYYNPNLEALMQQARTVPDCDVHSRALIYGQIEGLLQSEQPYAWLHVWNDMYVAQDGVLGFAPYPGRPFWNIRDWVVLQ
jgi:peptide/nickel transport system substrate-binding protein